MIFCKSEQKDISLKYFLKKPIVRLTKFLYSIIIIFRIFAFMEAMDTGKRNCCVDGEWVDGKVSERRNSCVDGE